MSMAESARRISLFPAGAIQMPPSKSMAHRLLICAALADGVSRIGNVSMSQDVEATVRCLCALGAEIELAGASGATGAGGGGVAGMSGAKAGGDRWSAAEAGEGRAKATGCDASTDSLAGGAGGKTAGKIFDMGGGQRDGTAGGGALALAVRGGLASFGAARGQALNAPATDLSPAPSPAPALAPACVDASVSADAGACAGANIGAGVNASLSACAPATALDCGESGSLLRFLMPVAALLPRRTTFTGRGRLLERPLGPYADVLRERGADIAVGKDAISISGRLRAGFFRLPGDISSQFVSGLLFALPLLDGDSEIAIDGSLQSAAYVDLTLDALARFGVRVERSVCVERGGRNGRVERVAYGGRSGIDGRNGSDGIDGSERFFVRGGQRYAPQVREVEADYSQAAFFLVAGALGCACECAGLSTESKQGDRAIVRIIEKSGAAVSATAGGGLAASPPKGRLMPQTVDVSGIPDLVPPLAALFSFCDGQSRIANAGRLRLKESDRLESVASELNAIGGSVRLDGDDMIINGARTLRGGCAKSWNDHRIAMMLAVAAIRCENAVILSGGECVAKSYPEFWRDFCRAPLR